MEYKEFINRGDVVVVAIGLVMALYFKAIVDQIIAALITPLIALIFGESNIAAIGFSISDTFFPIGLIFSAVIVVFATAVIIATKGQLGRHAAARSVEGEIAVEHALDDAATSEDPRRSDSPDA